MKSHLVASEIFRPSYGPDLTRVTVNSTLTTALLVANKTETRFICLLLVFNDFWDVFTKYNIPLRIGTTLPGMEKLEN